MTLFSPSIHPHGMTDERFVELFTRDKPVVFAFHGYQFAVHQLVHGRPHPARFHVRGFNEQGTTTTPFDMVVLNGMSRYHLAELAIRFSEHRRRPARPSSRLPCRASSKRRFAIHGNTSTTRRRFGTGNGRIDDQTHRLKRSTRELQHVDTHR